MQTNYELSDFARLRLRGFQGGKQESAQCLEPALRVLSDGVHASMGSRARGALPWGPRRSAGVGALPMRSASRAFGSLARKTFRAAAYASTRPGRIARPSNAFWSLQGGVPLEVIVALCNQLQASCHLNVPLMYSG